MPAFLTMDATKAEQLRACCAEDEQRLDPVQVRGGIHAGKWVLPQRLTLEPAFARFVPDFALMPIVLIAAGTGWPTVAEEE